MTELLEYANKSRKEVGVNQTINEGSRRLGDVENKLELRRTGNSQRMARGSEEAVRLLEICRREEVSVRR